MQNTYGKPTNCCHQKEKKKTQTITLPKNQHHPDANDKAEYAGVRTKLKIAAASCHKKKKFKIPQFVNSRGKHNENMLDPL